MGDEMLNTVKAIKTALGGESGGETYGSELLNTVIEIKDLVENGGGGSGLPEVTSADEGKVLAVNASGEWAAESVMINYDAQTDTISVSYNQLKNMIEHNKIPYLIYLRQDGGRNEYCLYRLASVYTNGVDDYAAIFMTFSDIFDGYSCVYFYNSSADASPMFAD